MKRARSFPNGPESVPSARRFATEALKGASPDALDAVTLMVSELASNCVRHADSDFDLTVMFDDEEIRVEATDRGGGEPRMRHPGPSDPTGRGLQIIDMLSTGWGVEELPGEGKMVWFALDLEVPAEVTHVG
jgi:anti-sigma regulatory factor (Ser/Thr protein kinase)